jgi:hypothetical protein
VRYSEYNQSLSHFRDYVPVKETPRLARSRPYGKLGVRGTATAVNTQPSLSTYTILVGESEGKRPFGRPKVRWKDNIKIYLRGLVCGDVD